MPGSARRAGGEVVCAPMLCCAANHTADWPLRSADTLELLGAEPPEASHRPRTPKLALIRDNRIRSGYPSVYFLVGAIDALPGCWCMCTPSLVRKPPITGPAYPSDFCPPGVHVQQLNIICPNPVASTPCRNMPPHVVDEPPALGTISARKAFEKRRHCS